MTLWSAINNEVQSPTWFDRNWWDCLGFSSNYIFMVIYCIVYSQMFPYAPRSADLESAGFGTAHVKCFLTNFNGQEQTTFFTKIPKLNPASHVIPPESYLEYYPAWSLHVLHVFKWFSIICFSWFLTPTIQSTLTPKISPIVHTSMWEF